MKTMLQVLAMVMVLVFMAGCGTLGMTGMVKALAQDPAIVTAQLPMAGGGSATFSRVGKVEAGSKVTVENGKIVIEVPPVPVPPVAPVVPAVPEAKKAVIAPKTPAAPAAKAK